MGRKLLVILAVISLCVLTTPTKATQKKILRKVHRAQHVHQPYSRHNKIVHASLAPLPPVLDTTCIDTLSAIQRNITTEINRWSHVRYRHGGTSPRGIDCSGFTYKVFEKALKYTLPRTSRAQALVGDRIDKDRLEFGDLLFFYSKSTKRKHINHVAIYIGDGNFVHSRRHHGVGMDSLDETYYARHFAGAKRVIPLAAEASQDEE